MALDDFATITDAIAFDPKQLIGVPFALVGAVLMAVGAQLQHRGVGKVGDKSGGVENSGLSLKQLMLLFKRPSWLTGTVLLGLAIIFQLVSLAYSPLIVVQPIGAVALVITSVLNSRVSKTRLNKKSVLAISLAVGGIGLFVGVAAFTAVNAPMTDAHLYEILGILAVVLVVFGILFAIYRKGASPLYWIVGAGVLYGFVATLAKVVITNIFVSFNGSWLTWTCLAALIVAAALGAIFVQNAYTSGPPDLVIAGLTVIDPIVAVTIGIVILDEASQAPLWAILSFIAAGIIAIIGVVMLAKYHPDVSSEVEAVAEDAKHAAEALTKDAKESVERVTREAKDAVRKLTK